MKTEEEYNKIMEEIISIFKEEDLSHFEELMVLESIKSLTLTTHLIEIAKGEK